MQRILSAELPAHVGARITIAGWIHRRRLLKSVAFLIVRDAAGLSQAVIAEPQLRELVETLPEETVVAVEGTVTANPAAPGGVELTEVGVRLLGEPAQAPPFDLYRPVLTAGLPSQLDHAPLSLRHPSRSRGL